jgi:hypothetical protein
MFKAFFDTPRTIEGYTKIDKTSKLKFEGCGSDRHGGFEADEAAKKRCYAV